MKTPHFRPIVATALAAIGKTLTLVAALALAAALPARAATYTRTYLFSGGQGCSQVEYTGYLYEQSAPSSISMERMTSPATSGRLQKRVSLSATVIRPSTPTRFSAR